jgi:hypothetical protein
MKTLLIPLLALTVAIAADSSFATNPPAAVAEPTAAAIRVRTVSNNGWEITRGMPAQAVLNHLGQPDLKLSANAWVYYRFHAVQKHPNARECKVLLVTLTDRIVTDLHLVCERAQGIITARVRRGSPPLVAARG